MSLDQQTAIFRHSVIKAKSVNYNLNFILQDQQYYGLAEISFSLSSVDFPSLPLDFRGRTIQQVIANSITILPEIVGSQMIISKDYLQKGRNKISISYVNFYNNDVQQGCISYIDQGKPHIYTNFQPYGANRVFPCFDQPNLKAKFKLAVVTPNSWSVYSNEPSQSISSFSIKNFAEKIGLNIGDSGKIFDNFIQKVEENSKMTHFDYTEFLPTYIFCFTAGNYSKISSTAGTVPMTLFIAPSLYSQLKVYSNFIFDITQKTMDFFEKLFGRPYPFKKYDQIWIRGLKFLAMENAGIVTFDERSLVQNATETDYYNLAEVVAHELVHHWFGNLVTMDWWDDLWLNQSFANFLSAYSLEQVNSILDKPVQSPIINFRNTKVKGYKQDEAERSTHSIREEVKTTLEAESIFDGIVYGKGAAVIKQLFYLIGGKDNFSKALTKYIDRFAWENANIDDLLTDMQQYFPAQVPIATWKTSWLESPSLNTFECLWDSTDLSTSAEITIIQKSFSATFPLLRHHKFQLSLINSSGAIVERREVIVQPEEKTTISYDGSAKIVAIFVNSGDYCFLQNYIDQTSLYYFTNNILSVQDETTRALIWYNLSQMVKKCQMRIDQYLICLPSLLQEPLNQVVNAMLEQLHSFVTFGVDNPHFFSLVFNAVYRTLIDTQYDQQDRIQILQNHYVSFANSDSQITQLIQWLKGNDANLAHKVPSDSVRWRIVKKAFQSTSLNTSEKQQIFSLVQLSDHSNRAKDARVVCDTITIDNDYYLRQLYASFLTNDLQFRQRSLKGEGWKLKPRKSYYPYQNDFFNDIISSSKILTSKNFQFLYSDINPIFAQSISKQYYQTYLSSYQYVEQTLSADPTMFVHVRNIKKIQDQYSVCLDSLTFNVQTPTVQSINESQSRITLISNSVNYNCHISFEEQSDQYQAFVQITFTLKSVPIMLPIDCDIISISGLTVNGIYINPIINGELLIITGKYLKVGPNVVSILYSNQFNNDGLGCLTFTEAATQKQYIYTNFKPNGAHRLIPCFDQPSLKAIVNFNIICSNQNWIVAGNQSVSAQASYSQQNYLNDVPAVSNKELLLKYLSAKSGKYFILGATQPIPTYSLALIAGEYHFLQSNTSKKNIIVPISIYYPDSINLTMAEKLLPFYSELVNLSLQFYSTTLQIQFPFPKYDTVFIPHLERPVESAGLVTLNSAYFQFFQSPHYTSNNTIYQQQVIELAVQIAKLCANQWFGNLVTLRWWSDIWLNEGISDFFSYYCIEQIQPQVTTVKYSPELANMLRLYKARLAYHIDYAPAYHTIKPFVSSVNEGVAYFDAITRQKASTVQKQLNLIMGDTDFFAFVVDYLKSNSWRTADTNAFQLSLNNYFANPNITLQKWMGQWFSYSVNAPGVLSCPNFNPFPDFPYPIDLVIFQSSPYFYRKIEVTYFREDITFFSEYVEIMPQYATRLDVDNTKSVKAILLNSSQEDYSLVNIDPISLAFFQKNINNIQSSRIRMTIWFYMAEMVRSKQIKIVDFADLAFKMLPDETDDVIVQFLLASLDQITSLFLEATQAAPVRENVYSFISSQLQNEAKMQSQLNRQALLKNFFIEFSPPSEIKTLESVRKGQSIPFLNTLLNPNQQWRIVEMDFASDVWTLDQKTAIFDDQQSSVITWIDQKLKNNTCLTLVADKNTFQAIFQIFFSNSIGSAAKKSLAKGWNHPVHMDWLENTYKEAYFTYLQTTLEDGLDLTENHFRLFYSLLKPIDYTVDQVNASWNKLLPFLFNINNYEMLGHKQDLLKIAGEYQLRNTLMLFNNQ